MSLRVTLFKFAKEHNSTARPSVSGDVTHVTLKDTTSFLNPILELQTATAATNPTGWNYAYISDFKRYYFINDWVYNRGIWEAHLMVDVLASWKEEIGASSQYVGRSESKASSYITDTRYPAMTDFAWAEEHVSAPWTETLGDGGVFVVGIISDDTGSIGAVKYYVMSQQGMDEFVSELMTNTSWLGTDFGDVAEDLIKAIVNPFEYVVSCMWYPLTPSWFVESPRNVKLGWYELPYMRVGVMTAPTSYIISNVPIPKHPQASFRGDYLNAEPYSSYKLFYGPFGCLGIPCFNLQGKSVLHCAMDIDFITGRAGLHLYTGGSTSSSFVYYETQLGVPIQLAQTINNVLTKGISAIGGIATGAIGNFIGSAIGIGNPIEIPQQQEVMTSGSNGTTISFGYPIILRGEFKQLVDEDLHLNGRPLCQVNRISTLPGYNEVPDPHIEFNCTQVEAESISSLMKSGFYYA